MVAEWFNKHFDIDRVKDDLIERALKELQRALSGDIIQALFIEKHELVAGKVYDVSPDSQFAELQVHLVFKFLHLPLPRAAFASGLGNAFTAPTITSSVFPPVAPGTFLPRPVMTTPFNQVAAFSQAAFGPAPFGGQMGIGGTTRRAPHRELRCEAEAQVSVRVKDNNTTQVSVDSLKIDQGRLIRDLYQTTE
jgi:hypothetical protein